jgi:hypothetical protein
MAQISTLHIKIEPSVASGLKNLARQRRQTVGELVRKALASCYQIDLICLTGTQRPAVEAYQGGFIGLGKLAGVMGLSQLDMRRWLTEHSIAQNNSYQERDDANA